MPPTKKLTPEEANARAEAAYKARGPLELTSVRAGKGGRDKRPWFLSNDIVVYLWAHHQKFRSQPSQFHLVTPECDIHKDVVPPQEFSKLDGNMVVRRGDTILMWIFRADWDALRSIDEENLRKRIETQAETRTTDKGDRLTMGVEVANVPMATRTVVDETRAR